MVFRFMIHLREPFRIDEQKLMFPRNTTGLAHLVWNCRCTIRMAKNGEKGIIFRVV